jgi:hypothetical protein
MTGRFLPTPTLNNGRAKGPIDKRCFSILNSICDFGLKVSNSANVTKSLSFEKI